MDGPQEPQATQEHAATPEPEVVQEPAPGAPARRPPRTRTRPASAADQVMDAAFPVALRGYERTAVDKHLEQIAKLVSDLEANQLRENVVQRALDEVGEQTSAILQQAHETADEISAKSRAQAEGRIQRAEREAEITRQEADAYAQQIGEDTRQLWEERMRLIEEMRQFAEDVLAVADDALDRLPRPEPAADADGPALVVSNEDGDMDEDEEGQAEGVIEVDPPSAEDPTVEADIVEPGGGWPDSPARPQ